MNLKRVISGPASKRLDPMLEVVQEGVILRTSPADTEPLHSGYNTFKISEIEGDVSAKTTRLMDTVRWPH
jgi:hypothetical protein